VKDHSAVEAEVREWWHGTAGGYSNHDCRCDDCRRANTEFHDAGGYQIAYRHRVRSRPVPDHVHGTIGGYTHYACRCDSCRAAQREASARRRRGAPKVRTSGSS
jgi:hypothetical protein